MTWHIDISTCSLENYCSTIYKHCNPISSSCREPRIYFKNQLPKKKYIEFLFSHWILFARVSYVHLEPTTTSIYSFINIYKRMVNSMTQDDINKPIENNYAYKTLNNYKVLVLPSFTKASDFNSNLLNQLKFHSNEKTRAAIMFHSVNFRANNSAQKAIPCSSKKYILSLPHFLEHSST